MTSELNQDNTDDCDSLTDSPATGSLVACAANLTLAQNPKNTSRTTKVNVGADKRGKTESADQLLRWFEAKAALVVCTVVHYFQNSGNETRHDHLVIWVICSTPIDTVYSHKAIVNYRD